MKGLIVSFLAVVIFCGIPSVAISQVYTSGMTDVQAAELALQAAKILEKNENPLTSATSDEMLKYAEIGTAIGKALASTARELGVEANNFANTPMGIFAVILIAWHFLGGSLIHFIVGTGLFMTGVPTWIYFFRRANFATVIEYHENGKKSKKTKTQISIGETTGFFYWVTLLLVVAVSVSIAIA